MDMWDLFLCAWSTVHSNVDTEQVRRKYLSLVHNYTESHRFYHNLFHIQAMLQDLDEISSLSKKKKATIQLAIFYHDCIYNIGASDNEIQSKMVFDEDCKALGLEEPIAEVGDMIMSTALYDQQGSVNILGDLDLATLALPYPAYSNLGKLLFEEYGSRFTEAQMIEGRKEFLLKMLSLPEIFTNNPEMDSLAHANMGRQLAELIQVSK